MYVRKHGIKEATEVFNKSYSIEDRGYKTPCWIWKSPDWKRGGYGRVWYSNKGVSSHRFSWMIHKGIKIPKKIEVCHHCDVKPCVNPDHLFLGTHKENIRDAYSKNLIPALRGELNGSSKLTTNDVLEIRRLRHVEKLTYKKISEMFGIDLSNVSLIVLRKHWRHI